LAGLNVPVHDLVLVGVGETFADLRGDVDGLRDRKRFAVDQHFARLAPWM